MPAPTINRSTNATQNSGLNIVTVTADATLTEYVDLVLANAAGGAITLTLDDPSRNPRRVLVIKTDSSGNTVDVGGLATLAAQYAVAEVVSTGAAYRVVVADVGGTPTEITQGAGLVAVSADGAITATPAADKNVWLQLPPGTSGSAALLTDYGDGLAVSEFAVVLSSNPETALTIFQDGGNQPGFFIEANGALKIGARSAPLILLDEFGNTFLHDAGGQTTLAALTALADIDTVTVAPQGTPGSTEYDYYVIAEDAVGRLTDQGDGGFTTEGAATLNGTDFNRLTWPAVPGAVRYHVVDAGTDNLVGTVEAPTATLDDTGQATDPFTYADYNRTGGFYLKRGDATITADVFGTLNIAAPTGGVGVIGPFQAQVGSYGGFKTQEGDDSLFIQAVGGQIAVTVSGIDIRPAAGKVLVFGRRALRTVTTNVNASDQDDTVLMDATAGNRTYTLGDAANLPGSQIKVKRISTNGNTVTVVGTIDGTVNYALAALEAITVVSDGTNWWII